MVSAFQGSAPAADVVVRAMDSISPSEWPTLDFALPSRTNKREQNDNLVSPPSQPPARRDKHSDSTPQDMRKKKSDAASGREGRNQKQVRSTSAAAAARDDPSPYQKCLHASDVGSPSDSSPSLRSTFSPAKKGPSVDAESRGGAVTARTLVAVRLRPPKVMHVLTYADVCCADVCRRMLTYADYRCVCARPTRAKGRKSSSSPVLRRTKHAGTCHAVPNLLLHAGTCST